VSLQEKLNESRREQKCPHRPHRTSEDSCSGTNFLVLNNAGNTAISSYTFEAGISPTNWAGLYLLGSNSTWRCDATTIASSGSVLASKVFDLPLAPQWLLLPLLLHLVGMNFKIMFKRKGGGRRMGFSNRGI
jgi:hypothetical protein